MNLFHYRRNTSVAAAGPGPLAISGQADANTRILCERRDQQGQVVGLRAGPELPHLGENRCGTYLKAAQSPVAADERSQPSARFALASGTLSDLPELHFKRILAKTVVCSAAQLIGAAADFNPPAALAHRVQFST